MILLPTILHRQFATARLLVSWVVILSGQVVMPSALRGVDDSNDVRAAAPAKTPGTEAAASIPDPKVAEKPPLENPFGDVSHWLPQVKSFHLIAEEVYESTLQGIAKELRQIKAQFPDVEKPNPQEFSGLQSVRRVSVESYFDQQRLRALSVSRSADNRETSRELALWDGKRALVHSHDSRSKSDSFGLRSQPDYVGRCVLMWLTYIYRQPAVFWWEKTAENQKQFENQFGGTADFVLVDREDYHGVDCDVFLNSSGNQSDKHYIGAKDGRWYGAKEGIIAIPDRQAYTRRYLHLVEEFLGMKLDEDPAPSVWVEINDALHSLPQDKKAAWCRLLYARLAKQYTPVFEYWFSDFRDLGSGRFFPYREQLLFYNHEGDDQIFLAYTRTITVKEIVLDKPLDDRYFDEKLTDGAMIADEIHKPPLYYRHKEHFTPAEWQAILKQANQDSEQETAQRKKVEQLNGKPAPPLPTGDWLNSKPLTWADLRGKIVVLKFWSVGCGPCYNELSALKGPATPKHDKSPEEKDTKIPIVFIGVHAPGNGKEEIEKVVGRLKLTAPICLDRKQSDDFRGEFFAKCEVDRMPTTVAVDEEGHIIAHGSFSDVYTVAAQRSYKTAEKK